MDNTFTIINLKVEINSIKTSYLFLQPSFSNFHELHRNQFFIVQDLTLPNHDKMNNKDQKIKVYENLELYGN